jgi:hypothetical protein
MNRLISESIALAWMFHDRRRRESKTVHRHRPQGGMNRLRERNRA